MRIDGLDDAAEVGDGTVTAADTFTVSPADAECTAAAPLAKPAVTKGDTAAERVVSVALAVPFSRTVTVTCTADGRLAGEATVELSGDPVIGTVTVAAGGACIRSAGAADYVCAVPRSGTLAVTATAQGALSGLSLGWAAAGGAMVASPAQTAVAAVPSGGFSRTSTAVLSCAADGTVTVAVTAGVAARTVAVEVDCAGTGTGVACDDPLGSLAHGITARSGEITADAGCTSANRRPRGTAVYFARRHTFALDGPAVVTFDYAGSAESAADRLDTYLIVHRGHGAAAVNPLRSSSGRLRNVRLAAGDYTVEATTQKSEAVGDYTLRVNVRYDRAVAISGLAGAARAGAGPVRVTDAFTVTPPTSNCTAIPLTAVVVTPAAAISDLRLAGQRTVSAALSGPGAAEVTVRCTAAGRRPAQQSAVLTHAGTLSSITARAVGGGQCTTETPPTGIDAAYRCTFGRGNTVNVAADAVATGPTLDIAWDTAGGVTLRPPSLTAAVPSFAPSSTEPIYQRTATAELGCTAHGTATATATLPGTTAAKTALLTVTCARSVGVTGLADTTEHGTGSVAVSRDFAVSPTTAKCSADPAAARVTAGRDGQRTVSASITAPGTLAVTVTCRAPGHANGIRQVNLAAALPCAQPLGEIAAGTTTSSGTIVADPACTSAERHRANPSRSLQKNYYARRHTLTLASPAWVTVNLVGANRFGTYLVLLEGHSPDGTVLASDNNSGRRGDRLAGVFLESGRYTVEATTSRPRSFRDHRPIGDYGLAISVDLTPRVNQPSRLSVEKGGTISESWPYEPAASTVTLAASDSLKATVSRSTTTGPTGTATLSAAPARIGKYTATLTYANGSGSLSEDTEIVVFDGSCPPTGPDGLRARRMHHHDDGHGHTGCNAHTPPPCEDSYSNLWTPDNGRGHLKRNLGQCNARNSGGIIDDSESELLPWTPYDIDRAGNPILCNEARSSGLRDSGDLLKKCLMEHQLSVFTWNIGFDLDTENAGYEATRGYGISAMDRKDMEQLQRAVDYRQTVLVSTRKPDRVIGVAALDDAFVQMLCGAIVEYAVEQGVETSAKRVGGWAQRAFPKLIKVAAKLTIVLGLAQDILNVAYQALATDVACE